MPYNQHANCAEFLLRKAVLIGKIEEKIDYLLPLTNHILSERIHFHHWPSANARRQSNADHSLIIYEAVKSWVAEQYNLDSASIEIIKTDNGKPEVYVSEHGTITRLGNCYISISHCPRLSVWTVQDRPCAIDIECLRPRRYLDRLVQRLIHAIDWKDPLSIPLSDTELYDAWLQLDTDEQLTGFYALWTFAEAWCKWHGQTLWHTFDNGIPFPWPSWQALIHRPSVHLGSQRRVSFYHACQHLIASINPD